MIRIAAMTLFLCLLTALGSLNVQASPQDTEQLVRDSETAFDRGDFEQAIKTARSADRLLKESGHVLQRLRPLNILGLSLLGAGHLQEAEEHLRKALAIAEGAGDNMEKTTIANRLAGLYLNRGMPDEAGKLLEQARAAAGENGQQLLPPVLNNLGTLEALRGNYAGAAVYYQEAIALSRQYDDPGALCDGLLNLGRTRITAKEPDKAGILLTEAFEVAGSMKDNHDKASSLISIGRTAFSVEAENQGAPAERKRLSRLALQEALKLAERLGDLRSISYSSGYLGAIFEQDRLFDEALRYTRRAVLAAEQVRQGEALYLWQWQTGRILKALGKPLEAAAAYRQAVRTLDTVRDEISSGCFMCGPDFFREKVEPVYFGLADLLLDLSGRAATSAEAEAYLLEARRTIEAMKGAELHDYFRDPCVDAYIAKTRSLEKIEDKAAVLYVIPLEKRLELLLGMASGIKRFTVAVGRAEFVQEVKAFRRTLEKRTTREYMPHGQKLYSWLIAPLNDTLVSGNIETIVFVPDQWLRTVPLAALHDSRGFLVSRFAVASTQGLTLTDPKPLKQHGTDVLMAGLTEPVQGYPALESVADELRQIGILYPGKLLKDSTFVTEGFRRELSDMPFSIVHIASHGEFSGDVKKSFLLAWDDKLSMDQLEEFIKSGKYRKVPLELLTLSACQTATGDDKAALGLAGVAVKAGARSAIATLWSVSDEASYQLVTEFYRQFRSSGVTKAQALRQAQSSMLHHVRYQHPYYWAPFILIGNWL